MSKRNEPEMYSGSISAINCILAHNSDCARVSEQNCYTSADFEGGSRESYLTNTDKSPSTPVENSEFFKQRSLNLYLKTQRLYKTDKKVLHNLHTLGLQKLKLINYNSIVLYVPWNPAGNSRAGWQLAKNISNTDKARLAAKQGAFEKALANVDLWDYFATFTLDRTKQDRYDFMKAQAHLAKFLQRRRIKYIFVPERHKDGAWHFHAVLSGEMSPYLADFEGKALKNHYISRSLHEGKVVKHCRAYSESFGYNIIEPCRDREACVNYMMKYVLKTFDDENYERVSRRRYFASQGLKSPRVVMPYEIDLGEFVLSGLSEHSEKVYLKRSVPQN